MRRTLELALTLATLTAPVLAEAPLAHLGDEDIYANGLATRSAFDIVFPTATNHSTKISTCNSFCWSTANGTCDASGPATIASPLGAPFSVGNFRLGGATCGGTPVTLPTTLHPGQVIWFDFTFAPSSPGRFADTFLITDFAYHLFGTATSTFPCAIDATTACLSDGRFKVRATFSSPQGQSGQAQIVQLTGDTAYLWFFASSNVEAVVKIINGCGLNNNYWAFAGGLTNVNVVLTITDTRSGKSKVYTNPQSTKFQPVQDTSALAVCP